MKMYVYIYVCMHVYIFLVFSFIIQDRNHDDFWLSGDRTAAGWEWGDGTAFSHTNWVTGSGVSGDCMYADGSYNPTFQWVSTRRPNWIDAALLMSILN